MKAVLANFPQLNFALSCVAQACRMALSVTQSGSVHNVIKSDASFVTPLDYAVQALIGSRLENEYPRHGLVAEEESSFLQTQPDLLAQTTAALSPIFSHANEATVLSWVARGTQAPAAEPFWLLDPIDSTRGLLSGGAYSVQLAGHWDGRMQVAVMGHPRGLLKRTPDWMTESALIFVAARNQGSWWTTLDDCETGTAFLKPLHVSSRSLQDAVRLRAPQRNYADQSADDLALRDLVTQELVTTHEIPCGTTVRYPLLAAGEGDLLLRLMLSGRANLHINSWDHAAGSLLVEEAGGRVTDLDGKPLDFTTGRFLSNNRGLVASNGLIHDDALAAIARAEAIHRAGSNTP